MAPTKSVADRHSRGARWLGKAELQTLPLRHAEVLTWIDRYESNSPLLPCANYDWYGPERADSRSP